jgi:hypothetical protein
LFEGTAFRIDRAFGMVGGPRRGQNVVIIRESPKAIEGATVDDLEADVRSQSVEFNNGKVPPAEAPFRMAGEQARRWTSIQTNRGAAKIMRQMIVRRGDALYTITVTTSPKRDDGETILRDLVAAWRWT